LEDFSFGDSWAEKVMIISKEKEQVGQQCGFNDTSSSGWSFRD
jgi:hypothetical protein